MQKIEITTTQKVAIEYELASWGERMVAFFIDQVVIFIILITLGYLLVSMMAVNFLSGFVIIYILIFFAAYVLLSGKKLRQIEISDAIIALISLLVLGLFASFVKGLENTNVMFVLFLLPVYLFYSLVLESIMDGRTLGKLAMGMKVVKLTGVEPILNDYLIRWTFRMIDIWGTGGALASLLVGSSPKRQRLGDMVANTAVIRLKSSMNLRFEDIDRIKSLENYEVSYPGARQFSEQDMLLIKTTINRYNRYPNQAHREAIGEVLRAVMEKLQIQQAPKKPLHFLKTVINDYIVLTR